MVKVLKIENKRNAILTSPLSIDGDSNNEYKPPNILQMVFSLLHNVRPGADLTRFQLPPLFNLPKSHLQCYGESVYCLSKDMLSKCANGETPVDRMISVVAWSISTVRPLMFGVAPYNPILGETHHASRGTLNVLLEQVSHHPPVSALHATDETNGIELIWCQHAVPKFQGTTIETVVHGKRKLNLVQKGESYVMNSPKLLIRLLPKLGVDWVGNVRIKCQETGLEAELSFKSGSFLGFGGGNRCIKGKIMDSTNNSFKTLYEIHGQWDRVVKIKDSLDGKTKVLYDAKEVISVLPTPTIRDPEVHDDLKIENKKDIILTAPICLERTSDIEHKASDIIHQLIFNLLKNVRPGADLNHFQLPAFFNMPKSQLQSLGELVYSVKKDMLSKCAIGETAIDRMISVVAWSLSTVRSPMYKTAPFNPILGETHHVSRGTLNVLLEKVSHHPPVFALHATDETNNIELIWCQNAIPKFHGTYIEGVIHGKRRLNLLQKGESYVMNSPILKYRLLPKLSAGWVGNVKIKCQKTGLEAELNFKSDSFLGFKGGNGAVKGKIIDSSSMNTLYDIYGQWDRTVFIKDTISGNTEVLYNPKEVISGLPTPILRDHHEEVWQSESAMVWAEVSKCILSKEWEKAGEAKRAVEEKQREFLNQRKSKGEDWIPKHFYLSHTVENGWDCSPKQETVSPAPIIFPI